MTSYKAVSRRFSTRAAITSRSWSRSTRPGTFARTVHCTARASSLDRLPLHASCRADAASIGDMLVIDQRHLDRLGWLHVERRYRILDFESMCLDRREIDAGAFQKLDRRGPDTG